MHTYIFFYISKIIIYTYILIKSKLHDRASEVIIFGSL